MKITLKRIILVGGMLLAALFFLLALAVSFKVECRTPLLTVVETKGSIFGFMDGKQFEEIFLNEIILTATSASTITGAAEAAKVMVKVCQVFAVIGLILVIFDFCAIIGAFFLKTNSGARKLMIPFMAITIVMEVVCLAVPLALLSATASGGTWICKASMGPNFIFYVLGIVFFIAALIAGGVVQEKVLVGKE